MKIGIPKEIFEGEKRVALTPQSAQALPQVRHVKLDTEANPRTGAAYNIRSIPTLALFQAGREVARVSGAMGAADLQRWLQQHLA